jgi:hypothetical protein
MSKYYPIWKIEQQNQRAKIFDNRNVLVEQRGIEPLASALRTRFCSFY